ncbi:hypothetical protein ES676_10850 [Bizionia saleffrena]|uniref:Formyl transferase N-terminal domain-containing protein n=1 Tax=Bizionia saleffrena TaxID=291189 RepID=A0A8H2QIU6_9FLAO|nr:formyl transferase [Bizionia saleffrena]TYB72664.1 hypothetical protein ES676_10850 [Bizionia saleffrena]
MNIVLFLNKDLEANIVYNLLKKELLNHTVKIYYSDTVGNPLNKPADLLQLEYFEKEYIYNTLPKIQKEQPLETAFEFFDADFKSFPIEKCTTVNSAEFIAKIKDFNPDLFISIRFGKIFKDEIIQIPKKGILNLHSAILPNYRGIMGTLHALKEQNKTIGCTLHTIPNNGIDTGEIIDIATLNVNKDRSLFWHIVQLYPLGAELIIAALKKMKSDSPIKSQKQNLNEGHYFSVPTQKDFEDLKNLGMEIISENDYIEILTHFIFKNASTTEKQHLKKALKDSKQNHL